tara:strand:- start:43 stop:420 length:378 start_codon:yes stop_codon:yes gene_type:complete
MNYQPSSEEEKFLTAERFKYSRLETQDVLKKLRTTNYSDVALLDQIEKEDLLLKIKLRSFNKCKFQFLVSIPVIIVGLIFKNQFSIFYIVTAVALYFLISSFFGLRSNKISKLEKRYSTNSTQNF